MSPPHRSGRRERRASREQGDRNSFAKKLTQWTRIFGLDPIDRSAAPNAPPDWLANVSDLYQQRNDVGVQDGFMQKMAIITPSAARGLHVLALLLAGVQGSF